MSAKNNLGTKKRIITLEVDTVDIYEEWYGQQLRVCEILLDPTVVTRDASAQIQYTDMIRYSKRDKHDNEQSKP